MRVLILGGDGYLGWPTAMYLSARGHDVTVADSGLKRRLAKQENSEPLFDVPELQERAALWEKVSGRSLKVHLGDLNDWEFTADVFRAADPEGVVHYAEQPSAPYSMLNREAAMLTLQNNLSVTANVIFAAREFCPDAHIVKLGTMGEYGTPNIDIEEGWLDIEHKGRKDRFLYPRQASSLYHTTKIQDTDLLWFYVRMWGLRVTDLMQGPVYGVITHENKNHPELYPSFNYDELFGTVINRFIVQAVAGYPLTVYGKGGQTRGYLDLRDTLQCVCLSLENPPGKGELRIFNQFVETFTVLELAERIQAAGSALDLNVNIKSVTNPRQEAEEHYYNPTHTGLLELGLTPHFLTEESIIEMLRVAIAHKSQIDKNKFVRNVTWS